MFKREVIDEQEMLTEMQKINAGLKSLEQELAGYEKQLSEQAEKEISANRIAEVSKLSDTLSRAPATSLP